MPKYTLVDQTPPVKLFLRDWGDGSVSLTASGGSENDEQILLDVHPDGHIVRKHLDAAAAERLGFKLDDRGFVLEVRESAQPKGYGSATRSLLLGLGSHDVED